MKNFWNKSLFLSGALALTVSVSTFSHAQSSNPRLFEIDGQGALRTLQSEAGIHDYLGTLMNDPSTVQIQRVNVKAALIAADTQMLSLPLPDGREVNFQLKRFNTSVPGMDGWVGDVPSDRTQRFTSDAEVDMDPFNWISLVRDGDQLVGSIHVDGQAYRLEYVGAGQHVLVKVDESKLPPEAEPMPSPEIDNVDLTVGHTPQSAHSTIRVLFVSTELSRAKYPNYRVQLVKALQDANQSMINSRVNITYELAGFHDADYNEEGHSYGAQLSSLTKRETDLGREVYRTRDALRADLVSMLSTGREYCGLAYVNAGKSSAYSVISCLGSLAHELGHNLGATHNWEPGQAEGNPPYMYGYRYTGTPRFRTQLSYDCSGGTCPRVLYHSNPRVTYQGIPVGTARNHDVARRFNERRETVENFYPPVLDVTLYEHSHHAGRACRFIQEVGSAIDVRQQCGAEWGSIVSSAKVLGLAPGITVRFEGAPGHYEEFISKAYRGALPVYLFGEYPDMSSDIDWVKTGFSINDKVSRVSISR